MSREIYLDIDDTLISKKELTTSLFGQISEIIEQPVEKVIEIKDGYLGSLESTSDFHPNGFMKYISDTTGEDYNDLLNILDDHNMFQKALFLETMSVLRNLKGNYRLGTFSQGFEDFQMRKLTLSGIVGFFDPDLMIIERRKLTDDSIKKIKPGSTVVEDKRIIIEELVKHDNFRTIWINRNQSEPIENVTTISSLTEISDLMNHLPN